MDEIQKISCSFDNQSSLYLAYMPFVKGGGVFIRTHHLYQLGSVLIVSVKLIDEHEVYRVEGKVVWITPRSAQGNKFTGIGVQFIGENGRYLKNKIESYLAEMPTDYLI
ncbi:PilZ domain-containing protein [Legionella sp.]|uniref:PilZ domain-containing protein n=1 Tax=Legionella sp. TaxID=459 RepID=UPI003C8ACD47